MSKFSKAVTKMQKAEKKLKSPDRLSRGLSRDPKCAELERRLFDASAKVKKEGITNA